MMTEDEYQRALEDTGFGADAPRAPNGNSNGSAWANAIGGLGTALLNTGRDLGIAAIGGNPQPRAVTATEQANQKKLFLYGGIALAVIAVLFLFMRGGRRTA